MSAGCRYRWASLPRAPCHDALHWYCYTVAGRVGRNWVARDRVGVAYTRQPTPGTINKWLQCPSYTIHTCFRQSHAALTPQTNRLKFTYTGPCLNEASALAVNCHTSLCVHSHSKGKEKEKKAPTYLRAQIC